MFFFSSSQDWMMWISICENKNVTIKCFILHFQNRPHWAIDYSFFFFPSSFHHSIFSNMIITVLKRTLIWTLELNICSHWNDQKLSILMLLYFDEQSHFAISIVWYFDISAQVSFFSSRRIYKFIFLKFANSNKNNSIECISSFPFCISFYELHCGFWWKSTHIHKQTKHGAFLVVRVKFIVIFQSFIIKIIWRSLVDCAKQWLQNSRYE